MATKTALPTTVRPLHTIAGEILADPALKGNSRTYAEPYLRALRSVRSVTDAYGQDNGDSLARYAVSNLAHYRGETARRLKAELRAHFEVKDVKIVH
jgi:hypothetical protein